jgi:hypothetical protein
MKARAWLCMVFVPWVYLYADAPCSPEFINSEKDIQKSYKLIQKTVSKCNLKTKDFLNFSKQAFLAGQYSMAIWSSKTGLAQSHENSGAGLELGYFLGISYLEKDRFDEAIKTLKEIVFDPGWQNRETDLIQKAHMALVEAYYRRNNKNDENVKYLVRLFKNRYPSSSYLFTLRSWNAGKQEKP